MPRLCQHEKSKKRKKVAKKIKKVARKIIKVASSQVIVYPKFTLLLKLCLTLKGLKKHTNNINSYRVTMLSKLAFTYFDEQYKPELAMEMIRFCSDGKSPESFAAHKDLSPEIFAYWAKVHPEFEIALHISFWKGYAFWENEAMNNPKINDRVYKAIMENRFKWKNGQEDMQRLVKHMNDQELEDLARRLLAENDNKLAIEVVNESEAEDDD